MSFLDSTGVAYLWGKIKSAFAAKSHSHAATDITSGTLPIARGGTGATTAADAVTNLGAAISGGASGTLKTAESDISALRNTTLGLGLSIGSYENATAATNHAVGDLFMLDAALKIATAAIASGETINGSNSANTTVVAQLKAVDATVGNLSTKIGNVGSTSLQSQVNTTNNTVSGVKTKTDKLSLWDASVDFVLSSTMTIRIGAATNRFYVQLCQDGTWTSQKNIATW